MTNPFRPAPGSEPPALVGRDAELAAFELSMRLTESGGAAQPVIVTGLRGMGKTVLLRRALRNAGSDAIVLTAEGSAYQSLGPAFRRSLERAASELTSVPERLKSAMNHIIERLSDAASKAFIDQIYDLNEAAHKSGKFVIIAIDEIQSVDLANLVPVVEFVHETAGSRSPALLIGAGLPTSKAHLHRVKTYSERWRYFRLELLDMEDTNHAFTIPLEDRKVKIDSSALAALSRETHGYPFFVQEFGSAAWTVVRDGRISADSVSAMIPGVRKLLDASLYDPAFERVTASELRYALTLARLGPGPHRIREVATALEETVERVNWIRNQLVKKEIVYVPASGLVEFRLPLSDKFLLRNESTLARRS